MSTKGRDETDKMTAPTKVTDAAGAAPDAAVDQTREAAKQVFEKIKSAREKAAKKVD